ncbi:MAG TPA: hypothetical protein VF081_11440 [Solirubrobacterales bacterium]
MLFVFLLAAFSLSTAASAQAALLAPILTDTTPASPNASFLPRVEGEIEEDVIKAAPLGIGLRAAPEPNNTVKLYVAAGCAGPVVGEGTAAQLEAEGVQVTTPVAADAVTTFFATQGNGGGTSPCSTHGLPYRQVTTSPSAPLLESVSPASPADDNFPLLFGTADPEADVLIYASADCSGPVVGGGFGDELSSGGIQVHVSDNTETTFSAEAELAGLVSDCSPDPIVYREVTPPPDPGGGGSGGGGGGAVAPFVPAAPPPPPRLRTVPGGFASDSTPLVTGSAIGASTVRIYADPECKGNPVATASLAQFLAGVEVRVLDNDVTVFSATASNGKTSPCSEPVVYVEDSLAPHTRITMGPASKTAKRKAIFRFMDATGNLPGTTFKCRVDGRGWKRCTSPLRLRNLKPKRHTVEVKATDAAGNAEVKGAKRRFKVIQHP